MKVQNGQLSDIRKKYPFATVENCEVIAEGGNDNGITFLGSFLVKIKKNKRIHYTSRFTDGKFIKQIK